MSAEAVTVAAIAGLGLIVGSFLNVVIYRVPRGESLLFPSSHCPGCGVAIKPRHNVPVVSWLVLRGRCAACHIAISVRYPIVELGTAALFGAVAWRLGLSLYLPAYLFITAIGITLAMIDIDGRVIPNSIVLPAYVIGAGLLLPAVISTGAGSHVGGSALGVAAVAAAYVVAAITSQRAIEPGLALLAGLLGFYLGWLSWLTVVVAAAMVVSLVSFTRTTLIHTGRHLGASSLPIGMLVMASAGLALLLPLPIVSL